MNIFEVLARNAWESPFTAAVKFRKSSSVLCPESSVFSYADLFSYAYGFGAGLSKLGLKKGERIAVFLPNIPEYPVVTYGALRVGAVPVLLSSALKKEKVREYVAASQARVLVTSSDFWPEASLVEDLPDLSEIVVVGNDTPAGTRNLKDTLQVPKNPALFDPIPANMYPHDPAFILYTSGTTGEQKGAILSHWNVLSNIEATVRYTGMTARDVTICFLPLFHCFGQNFIMNATFFAGGTMVLHRRFDLAEVLASLQENHVSMFFSVPPNFNSLLGLEDLSPFYTVRYFFSAADTISPDTVRKWLEKYQRQIWEGWGLTETSPFASYNHESSYRYGSVGTAIQDVEIGIADDMGQRLGPDEVGEIVVRGPNVFQGYFNDPEATRAALREGWFFTGDIGKMDRDGYLYVVDRKNDRIKVSGFSVWPREIEKFIRVKLGARIKDVGVIGVPDKEKGQVPFAYVVKADPVLAETEITGVCKEGLAAYQRLHGVKFVTLIPRTPTGKILKQELRSWDWQS